MECPKCHKTVGENDAVCRNCGLVLKDEEPKKKKQPFFSKPKKKEDAPKLIEEKNSTSLGMSKMKKPLNSKFKYGIMAILAVLVFVLVVVVVVNVLGDSGSKTAIRLSQYIEDPLTDAEKDLEIHLKDNSDFAGVNNALTFDYIYESDDGVKVDEVKYPEWAVTADLDEDNNIVSVTYTDFTTCEKNYKGAECDKEINLDAYEKGTKLKTVLNAIDIDPYSITYMIFSKTYIFKYYYLTDNGDAQQVILSVTFDGDDKLNYYSSTLVYPENM